MLKFLRNDLLVKKEKHMKKTKQLSFIYIFLLILPLSVSAELKKDISRCSHKKNDSDKLICYENIAHKIGVHQLSKSKNKSIGNWKISRTALNENNQRNVTLRLAANSPIRAGNQPSTPSLVLRCRNNRTSVQVEWNAYISDRDINVNTRFDDGNSDTKLWLISSDYTATFPIAYNYLRFAKTMLNHEKMDVEVTPYGRSTIQSTFDLKGLRNAIWSLRKACHW